MTPYDAAEFRRATARCLFAKERFDVGQRSEAMLAVVIQDAAEFARLWREEHPSDDNELTRLRAAANGAADLRKAFHRAAEEFHAAGEMNKAQQAAWAKLYQAIVGSTAGLFPQPPEKT